MVVHNYRYIIQFLFLVLALAVLTIFYIPNSKFLHIITCDVGQGDAILVTYKSTQILTDGGPNNKVVECLSKYMPFYDRTLELVILTHPDADHSTGLIEVFKRYKVVSFLENDSEVSTQDYKVLKEQVGSSGVEILHPSKDLKLRLGLIYLDILNPMGKSEIRNPKFETIKTNDMGIVILLTYGQFNALFTADVENEVSDEIAKNPKVKDLEYIKVNHHGSKNGLSQALLDVLKPEVAVISVGKNNRYGHPHESVLNMLASYELRVLRTDEVGDVEIITNGERYWY